MRDFPSLEKYFSGGRMLYRLSVSQEHGGDNCHLPSVYTEGRFWGQVYVAGMMPT